MSTKTFNAQDLMTDLSLSNEMGDGEFGYGLSDCESSLTVERYEAESGRVIQRYIVELKVTEVPA